MATSDPSLSQVIADTIEARLTNLHTLLPGKVNRVDVKKGLVDVQPLIQRKYPNGDIVSLPVIPNIPIANYRSGTAFISLPVKVGDTGALIFSERSLDLWKSKGGLVDPQDPRKHHLSDAVFYPGMSPFTDPPTGASADDIIIKNKQSVVTIKPTGKYLFTNGTDEIMDLLVNLSNQVSQIAATLNTTTTNTAMGPMKLNDFATFGTIKTAVDTIKSKLTGLKG